MLETTMASKGLRWWALRRSKGDEIWRVEQLAGSKVFLTASQT